MTPALMAAPTLPARVPPHLDIEIEPGRFIWTSAHAFARRERVWVPVSATLADMAAQEFPRVTDPADFIILVDGMPPDDLDIVPPQRAIIEISIAARKGIARQLIRAVVVFAAVFVSTLLFGASIGPVVGATVGAFLGNLLANALIPPSAGDGRLENPSAYAIEGVRNTARIGQPVPVIFGTHRVFGDVVVPFYQEVVGDDVYIRGGLCWGYGDYALAELKNGDTLLSNFEGFQVQHSLTEADPTPTLIPGIITPAAVGADLTDSWTIRTTAANAEEVEIVLFFKEGLGELTDKGKKRAHSTTIEVQYREVPDGGTVPAWRTGTAATVPEADDVAIALGLGFESRRDMFGSLGTGYSDNFHTGLGVGGSVDLSRTFTSDKPGEPFFKSFKFALPPGRQFEIQVKAVHDPHDDEKHDYFDAVTWTVMNSWRDGNPFPNPRAAVTAVRIKASEEISGVIDQINAVVSNLVRTFDPLAEPLGDETAASFTGSAASSNGADQLLHMALGRHRRNPTPEAEIDWPGFARFWELCDANGFTFNHVETSGRRLGEVQQLCGTACRARVMRIAGKLTPVLDAPKPDGRRTLLTPNNARDFRFQKLFPSNIHALRVVFPNKDNDYRQDERIVYVDGYDASTATKIQDFSMPGVDDAALIFRHAQYFSKSEALQTESGSCVQDIEGKLLIRYGDRVGVCHQTVQLTSESGWVEDVYYDDFGFITGFRLSERTTLNETDPFVARWREVGDNGSGEAVITANHLAALSVDAGGAGEIETNRFTFAAPLDPVSNPGLKAGALAVVGIQGEETIDALVKGIEPLDDEGKSYRVDWTLYAEARFEELAVPGHTPQPAPDLLGRPPEPVLSGYYATDDGIFIAFIADPGDSVLTGFEVWFRETPEVGADAPWHPLANLPAGARLITLPAGRPGQSFDVRLVAAAAGDKRSDPVVGTGYLASIAVPAPDGPTVAPVTRTGPDGGGGTTSTPVINVAAVAPDDTALLPTLVVEVKRSADVIWQVATTAPSTNPVKDITGLAPGEDYDVRLSWRNLRGAQTPIADRPVIEDITVGNLIVSDTRLVDGVPATSVRGGADRAIAGLAINGDVNRAIPGAINIGTTPASTVEGGALRANAGLAGNGDVNRAIPGAINIGTTPASTVEAGAVRANAGLDASGDLARDIPFNRAIVVQGDGTRRRIIHGLETLLLQDGDAYTFDDALESAPSVVHVSGGILTDGAITDPVQDIGGDDVTTLGFTARAKLRGQTSGGTAKTDAMTGGHSSGPEWQADKSGADPVNGAYTFSVTVTVHGNADGGGFYEGQETVTIWTDDGGGFVNRGTMVFSYFSTNTSESLTKTKTITLTGLGTHGGEEFGASLPLLKNNASSTITAADVSYSAGASTPTTVSATPGDETVRLQVIAGGEPI